MSLSSPRAPEFASPSSHPQATLVPSARGWFDQAVNEGPQPDAVSVDGSGSDALFAFASEAEAPAPLPTTPASKQKKRSARAVVTAAVSAAVARSIEQTKISGVAGAGLVLVALASIAVASSVMAWQRATTPPPSPPRPAALTVATLPVGAEVSVDGQVRGVTPLTLSVAPGVHQLTVRVNKVQRVVPLTLAAGAEASQYFELGASALPASGRLSIATDPDAARVTVDGIARGTTPVTVPDLAAGQHRVKVTDDYGSVERLVSVESGATASVMFSLRAATVGIAAGWLAITAPFDVDVLEKGELIGAGGVTKAKIMLAGGRHDVVLSNQTFEYRDTRTIDVAAGKTTTISIVPPTGTLSINAQPWADVSIDGVEAGQTPIANLRIAVGTHELMFRHPRFGERRQSVVVRVTGPNRLAVDLTK
jgi:hypothetical protein